MSAFRLAGAALPFFVLLVPVEAHSEGARRVVLQTASPTSSTARRLTAELVEHDVEVVIVPPQPDDVDPLGPKGYARDDGAIGVILLRPDASSAVVWVKHADTGEVTVREIVPEAGSRSSIDDTIAIGAREVVRAVLVERPLVPEAGNEMTLPQPKESPRSSFPRLALAGGFGGALGAPQLNFVPQVSFDARLLLNRWLGVRLLTSLGLWHATVGDGVSSADVNAPFVAGNVTLGDAWFRGPVRPSGGVGLLGARVEATGHTSLAASTRTEIAWVLAPYATAGVSFRITDALAIRADGLLAIAPRAPNVRLAGNTVARWGMPAIVGTIGLEVGLGP